MAYPFGGRGGGSAARREEARVLEVSDRASDATASEADEGDATEMSRPKQCHAAYTITIDHAANIVTRARAYCSPDNGDVIGITKLRRETLIGQLRKVQAERDNLALAQAVLDAELEAAPPAPVRYNAPLTPPAKMPPRTIPALIRQWRENARGIRKSAFIASSALVPAIAIGAVEIVLLSQILGYSMPEVAGNESVSTGLLGLAFISVIAGAYFALEKAGPRVRSIMDKFGAGAVFAYVICAGGALGLKGSGLIGSVGAPVQSAADWSDTGASFAQLAAASLIDTLGSGALAVALTTVTILSVVAIEHLLRIALNHAGQFLTKRSAARRADKLEADMTRIEGGHRRLAREINDIGNRLSFLARDIAADINALAAPSLARAEEQLAQMAIVDASQNPGFDVKAFAVRIVDFRDGIDVDHLRAIITKAEF